MHRQAALAALQCPCRVGAIGSDFQAWHEKRTPLGRAGQVQDIAPIVAFLASSDAGRVTGEIILGSGGMR
ncbi:SDR family oxidoreductase [Massilia oculi]|uniref:SDR family oxidoreductase n=1 Tax=Massilia oculi TaxID=945844 RepID=UPI001E5BAF37|nr:SDR family oxidoreductase [Massilia oculi]